MGKNQPWIARLSGRRVKGILDNRVKSIEKINDMCKAKDEKGEVLLTPEAARQARIELTDNRGRLFTQKSYGYGKIQCLGRRRSLFRQHFPAAWN